MLKVLAIMGTIFLTTIFCADAGDSFETEVYAITRRLSHANRTIGYAELFARAALGASANTISDNERNRMNHGLTKFFGEMPIALGEDSPFEFRTIKTKENAIAALAYYSGKEHFQGVVRVLTTKLALLRDITQ